MTSVDEIMTRNPVCAGEDDLLTNARSLVRKYKFRVIPVVDDGGKLVGVVSRRDILQVTSTRANLTVKAIMNTNPVFALPGEDTYAVAKKFVETGIRQFPVINGEADRKVIGIISSKDTLKAFLGQDNGIAPRRGKEIVKKIMVTDVIYCEQDDELSKVWPMMYDTGITGLPVVEQKKNKKGVKRNDVVGMITQLDIIKHGAFRLLRESGRTRSSTVRKIMRTSPITIAPDKSTGEAAELMLKHNIVRLPVVDDRKGLVGIITVEDVLRAYAG
ncbi:MAG: hypothetical protein A7316_08600 [Candidatus Altiarchaeales archaeon WOR_SM1_86-2]|nr:MAG: hypothetical protein A7316_08600 [Candidatus Altiarchaeales archaeon WOR_SM1_86-2]